MQNKQKGFGFFQVIIIIIGAAAAIYGFQFGMVYLNKGVVEKATKDVLLEYKGKDGTAPKDIKRAIVTKISVNNIDLAENDIDVTRNGNGFDVQINYQKSINITKEFSVNFSFDIDESTP